jgi:hypothetical protein
MESEASCDILLTICQTTRCHTSEVSESFKPRTVIWCGTGNLICSVLCIMLYFSILLHCIVQCVLQIMFPSACSFIACWFPLSFTTWFALHGHLQVFRIIHIFKDSVGRNSGNQHTIKLHADGDITCNTHSLHQPAVGCLRGRNSRILYTLVQAQCAATFLHCTCR